MKHVTSSTYKVKPDNWRRFSVFLPETARKPNALYFDGGEMIGRNIYLPKKLRLELMQKVAALAEKHGSGFGTCREGISNLNTEACGGSWLINRL